MEKIRDFRKMNLYKHSLRYSKLILDWTVKNRSEIGEKEFLQIRRMAMSISKNIAKAVVDININNKFKKLNWAKVNFLKLMNKSKELGMNEKEKRLAPMSLEMQKLFNGYFGYLGKRKKENGK